MYQNKRCIPNWILHTVSLIATNYTYFILTPGRIWIFSFFNICASYSYWWPITMLYCTGRQFLCFCFNEPVYWDYAIVLFWRKYN